MSFHIRTASAVIVLAALVLPGTAHADVTDLAAAELTNTFDQVVAASPPPDPNVTCDVKAGGRDVNQRVQYVVGEVYGSDFGVGQGECVSLDTARRYTVRLRVQLEFFTPTGLTSGSWTQIPGCYAERPAASEFGVAVPLPPSVGCSYGGGSPYLNKYHRAHAILTPSIAGSAVRHAYSPVWFMAP